MDRVDRATAWELLQEHARGDTLIKHDSLVKTRFEEVPAI